MTSSQLYYLLGKNRFHVTSFRYTQNTSVRGELVRKYYRIFIAAPCVDACKGSYRAAHFVTDVMPVLKQWVEKELGDSSVNAAIVYEKLYTEEARALLNLETSVHTKQKSEKNVWLTFEWNEEDNTGIIRKVVFR